MTESRGKIRLGGVKFSAPLILFSPAAGPTTRAELSRLCRLFSDRLINLAFLEFSSEGDSAAAVFCIADEDGERAAGVLADCGLFDKFVPRDNVGAIALFPTRFSLSALGLSMKALCRAGLPIYAAASSVSQLVYCTDYDRLEEAAAALNRDFELPPDHTPHRPQFRVTQFPYIKGD